MCISIWYLYFSFWLTSLSKIGTRSSTSLELTQMCPFLWLSSIPWGRWGSDTTEWLHFHFHALEKEMATHSSVLAWRIPGTAEPGGLPSKGSHRVGHDWSDLAAAAAAADSILKSRDITFPEKICLVKAMVFPVVMYGCESWTIKKVSTKELMLLNSGVGEDSWESLGLQGDPNNPS